MAATGVIVKGIAKSIPTIPLEFRHQQMPGFLVWAVFGFLEVRGGDDGGLVVGGEDGEDV